MFQGKSILVTGGTGSFGQDFTRLVLERHDPARVTVYSRDEKKQHDMRLAFNDRRLAFVIGDVRDRFQIGRAMRGIDYVFHAKTGATFRLRKTGCRGWGRGASPCNCNATTRWVRR